MPQRRPMFYFNYAGLSPTRREAVEEELKVQTQFETMLFSESGVDYYLDQLDKCREAVGELLQARDPQDIAIVQNASLAAGIILSSLEFRKGDTIVTSDQEHPGVTAPLNVLDAKGVDVISLNCKNPEDFITQLEAICHSRRVRLILISHVSYKDGRILPIEEAAAVAKVKNTFIAVDGAQAVGHIPVDVNALDIDVYFFSGHKWCFGPMGTGAIYVTKNFIAETQPPWVGWTAKTDREKLFAKRFEIGTQNISLIAGMARACQLKAEERKPAECLLRFRKKVMAFMHQESNLDCIEWAGPHAPGILSFVNHQGIAPNNIVDSLYQRHDIVVKPINYPEQPNCIRLSWSFLTTENDITYLLTKLDACLRDLA